MEEQDKELKAMQDILAATNGLEESSQRRVLKYVLERLNFNDQILPMSGSQVPSSQASTQPSSNNTGVQTSPTLHSEEIDIRTLKEEKKPKSAIQMAVLLAYYLKEKAPLEERSEIITGEDVLKYFPQADYEMPQGKKGPLDTLYNAKIAGYLEATGGGEYKLNAVGYNLAAYRMGKETDSNAKKKTKKKTVAKKGKKSNKKK